MIKIEKAEVFGWEAAIRGMRNPLNSWDKGDSYSMLGVFDEEDFKEAKAEGIIPTAAVYDHEWPTEGTTFVVGEDDLKLMEFLAKAGDDHGKVIRYLDVYVDITAPLYWWKEFRTYRKGRKFMDDGDDFLDPDELEMHIETNSCSTMHKIHEKEFTLDDFSHEHMLPTTLFRLRTVVECLNVCRNDYLETKDKGYWWQMIQLLPSSYNQKRTVKLNYQVLKNMYYARKNHKLDEWREFCKWVETLPYFSKICLEE